MKLPRPILSALVEAACLLAVVYCEPTHCVRGRLWGEAFFDGRPTSYWRTVVEHDLQFDVKSTLQSPGLPSWSQRTLNTFGVHSRRDRSMDLLRNREADPVLNELRADANPKIAGFAGDIINEFRALDEQAFRIFSLAPVDLTWTYLVDKHNLRQPPSGMFKGNYFDFLRRKSGP